MSYNVNRDSGFAERQSWMQIENSEIPALTAIEGNGGTNKDKRFASLVYQVNAVSGGGGTASIVGINGTGTVKLSGDQLKVFDQAVVDAINNRSTTVSLSAVGLNADGDVQLSGDQLKVFDQQTINHLIELNIDKNYSRVIQSRGNDVYFAHAPIGTSTSTSGWRVQKIDNDGNKTWAATGTFTLPANIELSGLIYNY